MILANYAQQNRNTVRELGVAFTNPLAQRKPAHVWSFYVADDTDADLFGNEPVLLDGHWVGYVRAAAYGHTLGGPVGLAQVTCPTGVTAEWLRYGRFHVATPSGNLPARLQLAPFFDPQRLRILAE